MSAARLTRSRGMLALAASALLAACAAPGGETSATGVAAPTASVAAPHIQPPPTSVGTWVELGHVQAPWLAGDAPVPVSGPVAPTRVAGLRRDDGRWLAIVMVQRATGTAVPCPRPTGVSVATEGDGCLRLRRDADFDRWLERQHGVLHQWVESRGWAARPRAWVAYRDKACDAYGFTARGGTLEPMLVYACRADMTRQRITDLTELNDALGSN